ncbi:hypothetical protein [Nibribacter koreensis]|uniref:hypothetical protein n=1 Tax=Nibribacter koreensis TaxID=1084519 RepID=UPI0031EB556E
MKRTLPSKTTILLFAICVTVPLLAFTIRPSDWIRQHLDQRLSIEFPGTPTEKTGSGSSHSLYFIKSTDAGFIATAIHYNNQPSLKPITNPYQYYVSLMTSQIKGANGTLVDSSSFTLDNYRGLEFSFSAAPPLGKYPITFSKRVIFVDGRVYQAQYTPISHLHKPSKERIRKFFDSMRLTHM